MKILHIVRQYAPAIGGLQRHVEDLATTQAALGHECHVLTLDRISTDPTRTLPRQEMINGIAVTRVPFRGGGVTFIPFFSPKILRGYDIIHAHNTDGFFLLAILAKSLFKKPIVLSTHGGFFHTKRFAFLKSLVFKVVIPPLFRRVDMVIAVSESDKKLFDRCGSRVVLANNAVVPMPGKAGGEDFLYVGRLAPHKGIKELVAVFAELRKTHKLPGRLHIVGPEWGVTKEQVLAWAQDAGVGRAVDFHGYVDNKALKEIVGTCGFFMSGSEFEGFGMSLIEAMGAGLIPYVHNNAAFVDLLKGRGPGLCTDFKAPRQAAAAISASLRTVTQNDRKKAREFAAGFSWDALARRIVGFYEAAVRSHAGS